MVFTSRSYSGQGVTAGEYEILKEEKLQTWRAIDLEILDIRNDIKTVELNTELVNLESAEIGLEIAEVNRDMRFVDLEVAQINLQAHEIDIDIAQERLTQKQDEYSFEQFQTGIKRENYIVQANTAIAQLEMATQQLEELLDSGQSKHVEYSPQLDQLSFSSSSLMR